MTVTIDTRIGPLPSHTVVEAYRGFRKRLAEHDDVSERDDVLARVVRASGDEIKPLPPLAELEAE
jgi:hypothetical protein